MQIITTKTFNSRAHGLLRAGIGPITVDEQYGKALIRNGLAKIHVPQDMQGGTKPPADRAAPGAPSNAGVPRAPRTPETPPDPPGAGPRRRGQASGSATRSSGRRQADGAEPQS